MTEPEKHHNVQESADKIVLKTKAEQPWQEEEILEELYFDYGLTQPEMADILGCTNGTVSRWMNKHDIETRSKADYGDKPWQDKELINKLYHEKEMSGPEIADELDCSVAPVYERIEDTRSISEANRIWTWMLPLKLRTDKEGYEYFQTKVHGESMRFAHHRLIAVAKYGLDGPRDKVIHHKNGIPWDNRAGNLELMEQPDHVREHFEEIPRHEKAAIFALVEESDYRTYEVADMFDTKESTVTSIAKRIRDGDYPITGAKA